MESGMMQLIVDCSSINERQPAGKIGVYRTRDGKVGDY